MKDELEPWVRGLGARTVETTQVVEEEPSRAPPARKQKTHLAAGDLPLETICLEINGRPFYVVLRDERVYMAYVTRLRHVCIKRVKSRGAVETALELARLVHLNGCEWPDRNAALACNWPNVVAPPLPLVALKESAPRLTASPATRSTQKPSHFSLEFDGAARTEVAMAMLPSDAVEVKVANRTCYVLLKQNMVFVRVETWNASTAYLREITDLARKKRLKTMAEKQVVRGSGPVSWIRLSE